MIQSVKNKSIPPAKGMFDTLPHSLYGDSDKIYHQYQHTFRLLLKIQSVPFF